MSIKITYTDVTTGKELFSEIISDEEVKALETDMASVFEWISNAWKNKARQCIDRIVELSGEGSKFTHPTKKIEIIKKLIQEKSPLLKTAVEKAKENYDIR